MRKFLLAISLALFPSFAWAQNPTCPTRPPTDSSNACASTAFVQNVSGSSFIINPANYPSAQAAADVAANKILALRSGDSVTVAVPGTYSTCAAAMSAISRWLIPQGATVTVAYTGHINFTASGACVIDRPDADRIKHRPATSPLSTTLSSIVSVTGSNGAWSVTGNLADATGVTVGDVIRLTDVVPGVGAPGSYAGYPALGAVQLAFFSTGGSAPRGYLKTVGTTATVWQDSACAATPATAVSTFIHNTDPITVRGEVRSISGVGPAGFTLSSAFTIDVPCMQYWYNLPNSGTGTVSISGGTVTGNSTFFLRDYNVNDLIYVDGAGVARVTAISANDGAGAITLDRTLPNVTTANFGMQVRGELHEGSWLVTAINVGGNPNRITWTHTGQNALAKPPVLAGASSNITGTVKILTAVLNRTTNGGQGFVVQNGTLDLDQIAIVGSGTATSGNDSAVGIDLRGNDHNSPDNPAATSGFSGSVKLGPQSAVLNFGWNLRALGSPSECFAYSSHFTGATVVGVFLNFGPYCDLVNTVINGSAEVNLFLGPGTGANLSDHRNFGAGTDCVSLIDANRGSYAEFAYYEGCGSVTVRYDGNSAFHNNGARHITSTSGCIQSDNGGFGRMTGSLLINCGGTAVSFANAIYELSQTNILANGFGVIASNSRLNVTSVGVGNSTSAAFTATNKAQMFGSETFGATVFGVVCGAATSACINAEIGSSAYLPGAGIATASATIVAQSGSYIRIKGYTGTPGFTPAILNRLSGDGDFIDNGSTSTYSISGWTIDNTIIGGTTAAAGTFTALTATGAVALSPANANVVISPTGTGLVTINPASAGTINNVVIGGSTPLAITGTTVTATGQYVGHATNSVGAPAYTFAGDLTTGFYRIAASRIGMALGGALVMDFQAGGQFVTGVGSFTAQNAFALRVGRLAGATPAFQVDSSTASSITGWKITAAATTGGVDLTAIGETNVNARIDAAGTGTLTLNGTATGNILASRATVFSSYASIGTKIHAAGSAPAVSSCGTTPAISGSDLAGLVTTGTGTPTSCTITFNVAYAAEPYCVVRGKVQSQVTDYTVSSSAIVVTTTATNNVAILYHCIARSGGWLLNRDLDPASNDNTPAFMEKAA